MTQTDPGTVEEFAELNDYGMDKAESIVRDWAENSKNPALESVAQDWLDNSGL